MYGRVNLYYFVGLSNLAGFSYFEGLSCLTDGSLSCFCGFSSFIGSLSYNTGFSYFSASIIL